MFTVSIGNLTEVISKSGDFLNPKLARRDQLWLVRGVLDKGWAWDKGWHGSRQA
jgi:hypothetical protein